MPRSKKSRETGKTPYDVKKDTHSVTKKIKPRNVIRDAVREYERKEGGIERKNELRAERLIRRNKEKEQNASQINISLDESTETLVPEDTNIVNSADTEIASKFSLIQDLNSALSTLELTKKKKAQALSSSSGYQEESSTTVRKNTDSGEALSESSDEDESTAPMNKIVNRLEKKLKRHLGNELPPDVQKELTKAEKRAEKIERRPRLSDFYLPGQREKDLAFYREVLGGEPLKKIEKTKVLLVAFFLAGRETHWRMMDDISEGLVTIIPKGQSDIESCDPETQAQDEAVINEFREMGFPIEPLDQTLTRETCKDAEAMAKYLKEKGLKPDEQLIILDHGGYFAPSITKLQEILAKDNIIIGGVVENTENGHREYEKLDEKNIHLPIISIARCRLKNAVEVVIGNSVKRAAITTLRKAGIGLEELPAAIIGFGKVGKAIATDYYGQKIPMVVDEDPLARLEAHHAKVNQVNREEAIRNAKIIFCATANMSITAEDYPDMQDGCFIVSVTSQKQELQLPDPETYDKVLSPWEKIDRYEHKENGKLVHLVNGGEAANFAGHISADSTDFLPVLGLELKLLQEIGEHGNTLSHKLDEPSEDLQRQVTEAWEKLFKPELSNAPSPADSTSSRQLQKTFDSFTPDTPLSITYDTNYFLQGNPPQVIVTQSDNKDK